MGYKGPLLKQTGRGRVCGLVCPVNLRNFLADQLSIPIETDLFKYEQKLGAQAEKLESDQGPTQGYFIDTLLLLIQKEFELGGTKIEVYGQSTIPIFSTKVSKKFPIVDSI